MGDTRELKPQETDVARSPKAQRSPGVAKTVVHCAPVPLPLAGDLGTRSGSTPFELTGPTRIQRRVGAGPPSAAGGAAPAERSRIQRSETWSAERPATTIASLGGDRIQRAPLRASIGAEGGDVDSDTGAAIERARGSGGPIDDGLRRSMEGGFGADFSAVRIHDDAGADALSRSLEATAFTTGRDIFFRSGEYQPSTAAGRELVAHELAHVVQQGGARSAGDQTGPAPSATGDTDVRRRFAGNLAKVEPFQAAFSIVALYFPAEIGVSEEKIAAMKLDADTEYTSYSQLAKALGLPPFDPALLSEHSTETWTLKAGASLTTDTGTSSFEAEQAVKGNPTTSTAIRQLVIPKGTAVYPDTANGASLGTVPNDEGWLKVIVTEADGYYRVKNGSEVRRIRKGEIPFEVKETQRSAISIGDQSYVVDTSQLNPPKAGRFEPYSGPLFPPGGPRPEHVKQTNLGDCYFQAAAASIAHKQPKKLERILQDTKDGLVVVILHKVDESGPQPTFSKVLVTLEKSVPKSATGEDLYNQGELWVRLLEKAYARSGAAVNGADRPFRYEDIASGQGSFALRVLLGQAALTHTVASGPTLKEGNFFGLPVTNSVRGKIVSSTPTPLSVPWDAATFAAFQKDPEILHHDTFMQIERETGSIYVRQKRPNVQQYEGGTVIAGTVVYNNAGVAYAPLGDARCYRILSKGVVLPAMTGEKFIELANGNHSLYAKTADVTMVKLAKLPTGTDIFSTLQPPTSTSTTGGPWTDQRVLVTDICVPTFGLFHEGGPATNWMVFVQSGKLHQLFGVQGAAPRDVTIDDVRKCFQDNNLDRTVADAVLEWITTHRLLPGKLGTSVYSAIQMQIHGAISIALLNGKPVTASTKKTLAAASEVQASEGHAGESGFKGLVGKHAYSVLAALPAGQGGRLFLTVRNPWGEYGRQYDWSKAPEAIASAIEKGTGQFDIELSDFTKYFDSYAT